MDCKQALVEDSRVIEEFMNSIRCMVHVARLVVYIKANFDVTGWGIEEKKVCNFPLICFFHWMWASFQAFTSA